MNKNATIVSASCITPLGRGLKENWDALCLKKNGIKLISRFDPSAFKVPYAGEIDENYRDLLPLQGRSMITKQNAYLIWSVLDAWKTLKCEEDITKHLENFSVYVGTGYMASPERTYEHLLKLSRNEKDIVSLNEFCKNHMKTPPLDIVKTMATAANNFIAKTLNIHGGGNPIFNGDTSSITALNQAVKDIETGKVKHAIVASSEYYIYSYIYYILMGCTAFQISKNYKNPNPSEVSRPFDINANSPILSEGAACMILTSEPNLWKNSINEKQIVLNSGATNIFANNQKTLFDYETKSFKKNMEETLKLSGKKSKDIDLIFPFCTSNYENDAQELKAIAEIFGDNGYNLISSKGNLGFMSGTSGLLDCILAYKSMKENTLFPLKNFNSLNPKVEKRLEYTISKDLIRKEFRTSMVVSAGMGGFYSSIVLEKGN